MREAAKDWISSLPDLLLHHILSFLGTKDGARTSILSHRWNWIWTTVPVLDFQITKTSPDSSEKFMDFVGGTMHRHKLSNVYKFFLGSVHHLNESRVHSWISNVVSGNLKEIGLYLRQKQPLFIPLSLFTCESLIFLKLGGYPTNSICLPKYISFPSLKRLELTGFEISNECWNEELFSNSTVLEELILERCIYRMRNFSISIPTLKLLRIDAWTAEQNDLRDCVLKINAPRLVTFFYLGYLSKDFVLSSFPELMEAAVGFNTGETDGAEVISRLVCALAHVKCLTVCHKTIQAICSTSHLSNSWVTFHNVKMLKISDSLTTDKRLLALLKAVPNLESLVFFKFLNDEVKEDSGEEDDNDSDNEDEGDGNDDADSVEGKNIHDSEDEGDVSDSAECRSNYVYEDNYDNEDNSWALDIVTTGSLFPHLKSVCFQQFYARPRETKWVRLILSDAKALQMVTICYHGSKLHFADKIMVKIPSYPRASAGCLFNFKFCS